MNDLSSDPDIGSGIPCIQCYKRLYQPKETLLRSVVSRVTGQYYPMEIFCGEDCYREYTTREGGRFREPLADEKANFVRIMKPVI